MHHFTCVIHPRMTCKSILSTMGKPDRKFTPARPAIKVPCVPAPHSSQQHYTQTHTCTKDRSDEDRVALYDRVLKFYKDWDDKILGQNQPWRYLNAGTHAHICLHMFTHTILFFCVFVVRKCIIHVLSTTIYI